MSDKRFTFFELHLHDASLQLGPKSIGEGESEPEPELEEPAVEEETGSGPSLGLVAVVALVLLGLVAVAVKKLTGDEGVPSGLEELDELEE